jgi:hypothetical protein
MLLLVLGLLLLFPPLPSLTVGVSESVRSGARTSPWDESESASGELLIVLELILPWLAG